MATNQDKGEALRKRVVALFEKMLQFNMEIVPPTNDKKEKIYYLTPNKILFSKIDATIEYRGENYLVIECKNVSKKPIIADIADRLKRIKKDLRAKAGLIIITGVKISQEEIADIYEKYKIFLWNDELLSYYEKVASTLEEFSFYEIMHSLEIELEEDSGDDFRPAILLKQKVNNEVLDLVSFTAYPNQMIKKAYVFRQANKKAKAYQRLLKKDKLNKIASYIQEGGNIINTIIVLLPEECKFLPSGMDKQEKKEWYYGEKIVGTIGRIKLPRKYCFIEVIDGQHRLFSFTKCGDDLIKNFPLNFVGIIGGNKEIARDIFITINQNAKKIEANLLASIQEEYDKLNLHKPESLAREIVRELNRNSKSALKEQILEAERITKTQQKLKLYIAMLSYNGVKHLVKDNCSLRKIIGKNEVMPYYEIINNYIKRLRKVFPSVYQDNEKYVVFTNNGLIPLLRLLNDICQFYNKSPSNKRIDEVLNLIKDYAWDLDSIKDRSSGAGWKTTYDELIEQIRKIPKFKKFPKKE